MNIDQLDLFTRAYIDGMLWSSMLPAWGTCEKCGREDCLLIEDDSGDGKNKCNDCFDHQSSNGEPPADDNWSIEDFTDEALALIAQDCKAFQEANKDDLAHRDIEKGGRDLWFTRVGHGTGFWDGDWPEDVGERLTEAAKKVGERYLEAGDDGKLHYR